MPSASATVIPFPARAPQAIEGRDDERLPIQHSARLILALSVGLWGAVFWAVSWAVA